MLGDYMPKISVVMPVYNTEEKFLREAMESILNQTFTDFELIMINDCSTTNVEEIILSYKDARIIYLKNEQNMGVAATLNVGLKNATGKYIARMDADDVSFENRFEIQYNFLEATPQYQLCSSRISTSKGKPSPRNINFEYQKAKLILRGNPIIHPTVMFNREFFANNSLYYRDGLPFIEDWDLWFRLSLVGKFAILPEKLVYYRQHPNQENKIYENRYYELGKKQFKENFEYLGFTFNKESQELFLDFLACAWDKKINFGQWKSVITEAFRLLSFIKETKKVSYKYSMMIMIKKLTSYTRHALIHK